MSDTQDDRELAEKINATITGYVDTALVEYIVRECRAHFQRRAEPVIDKSMLNRLVTQVFGEGYSIVPPPRRAEPVGEVILAGTGCTSSPELAVKWYWPNHAKEKDKLYTAPPIPADMVMEPEKAPIELRLKNYDTLLMAVGNKYPGESRFDTALRYIKTAEEQNKDCSAAAPTNKGGK